MAVAGSCKTVKNAVKRNFSSTHFHKPHVVPKLSLREAQICSLVRIGGKTKKIWPLKLLGRSASVRAFAYSRNDDFSSTQLHDPDGIEKPSIS